MPNRTDWNELRALVVARDGLAWGAPRPEFPRARRFRTGPTRGLYQRLLLPCIFLYMSFIVHIRGGEEHAANASPGLQGGTSEQGGRNGTEVSCGGTGRARAGG
mmetsp:Transcript_24167/g.50009  ORF Transcript_24167/g.50009 Transcript_24167/m.50009 type:complete len:104 (+) Transcript_24167:1386-1697(+)